MFWEIVLWIVPNAYCTSVSRNPAFCENPNVEYDPEENQAYLVSLRKPPTD